MTEELNRDDEALVNQARETVGLILSAFERADAPPAVAVDAMTYIIGRILFLACDPAHIEANLEHIKAQILSSVAAHASASQGQQAETRTTN